MDTSTFSAKKKQSNVQNQKPYTTDVTQGLDGAHYLFRMRQKFNTWTPTKNTLSALQEGRCCRRDRYCDPPNAISTSSV
jgi:hypothetical protein